MQGAIAKKKHLCAFAVYSTRSPKFKLRRYQFPSDSRSRAAALTSPKFLDADNVNKNIEETRRG
jgi:hypothetical protein